MAYTAKITIKREKFETIYSEICASLGLVKFFDGKDMIFKSLSRKNHNLSYKLFKTRRVPLAKEAQKRYKKELGRKVYREKYKHNMTEVTQCVGEIYQTTNQSLYIEADSFNNIIECIKSIERIIDYDISQLKCIDYIKRN